MNEYRENILTMDFNSSILVYLPISLFFELLIACIYVLGNIYWCNAGETVSIVGDHDPALMKYFDCTRSGPRSAFDGGVVYQFETMEYVCLLSLFSFLLSVYMTYHNELCY